MHALSLSNASYQTKDEIQTPMQGAGGEPVPAWKMELNAKLAAHRQRRPALAEAPGNAPRGERQRPEDGGGRAAMVAARVAERYAKAPSYSEFLAASAAAAVAAAETAALGCAASAGYGRGHGAFCRGQRARELLGR